jgi:predicted NUDIX family NTP pyrophosphohydrolase
MRLSGAFEVGEGRFEQDIDTWSSARKEDLESAGVVMLGRIGYDKAATTLALVVRQGKIVYLMSKGVTGRKGE